MGSAVFADAFDEVFKLAKVRMIIDVAGIRQVGGDLGPVLFAEAGPGGGG